MESIEDMKNAIISDKYSNYTNNNLSYGDAYRKHEEIKNTVDGYTAEQVAEEYNKIITDKFTAFTSSINSKRGNLQIIPKQGFFSFLSKKPQQTVEQLDFWKQYDDAKGPITIRTRKLLRNLKEAGKKAYPNNTGLFWGGRRRRTHRKQKRARKTRRNSSRNLH